ncbi:MAG: hypothetical protein KF729_16235 [Sandaracinaceae bacterium]|nr:hypothetical protein [Sandaracinaceae bacterium]
MGGPEVDVPRVDPPPASGLVWLRDASGVDRTHWVAVDGRALGAQAIDGPVWAEGSALWQLVIESVDAPLYAEEPQPAQPAQRVGTAPLRRVVLRDLVANARLVAIEAPEPGPVRDLRHDVALVGSVGPFLFFVERLYVDAWGAHGAEDARAVVFDLRAGAAVDVATERERAAWAREAPAWARDLPDLEEDAGVSVVALWPRWAPDGLSVDLHVAVEACYACGDGEWSDYTRSVRVPLPRPPEQLAMPLPTWARDAAARVGGTLMGFTRVEHPAPAHVLDSLSR